jgi:hypothetical protein
MMNVKCNIKPVGKIMVAFGDHWRHEDLSLDQFSVFTHTYTHTHIVNFKIASVTNGKGKMKYTGVRYFTNQED